MSDGNNHQPDNIIEAHNLKKYFAVHKSFLTRLMAGEELFVRAVDGVSFNIRRGEVFGLAGESGSGKTTVGRLVVRLEEPTEGEILMDGVDLGQLSAEQLRRERRRMQVIFQDPLASLNPRMSIGDGIGHGVRIHLLPDLIESDEVSRTDADARVRSVVEDMMERVGLTPARILYDKYPHQLSGGQRQRAVIARALVTKPELILADEPIAMADVSVRALLLDLMIRLKDEFNLTYLFITHDLATAKYICDRIAIMYLGMMVEVGDLKAVYDHPTHPYTQALLAAVPVPDPTVRRSKELPKGEIPDPINPPSGCRFHPRCPIAQDVCREVVPDMLPVADDPDHLVACHLRTGEYQHLDPTRNGK
jgi:peptide/nickel transport system ATP-binding protein